MNVKLVRKSDLVTSKWPGGTTTQLAIYPEDANYKEKDFIFRISSAKVEAEESTFTKLPGVSRVIMILDGVLKLEHKGKYSKTLHKFDTDSFQGDWDTISYGRVIDFNLMTTAKATGSIQSKVLNSNESCTEILFTDYSVIGYYLLHGIIEIEYKGARYIVNEGDFILITYELQIEHINIKAIKHSEIIIPTIKY